MWLRASLRNSIEYRIMRLALILIHAALWRKQVIVTPEYLITFTCNQRKLVAYEVRGEDERLAVVVRVNS